LSGKSDIIDPRTDSGPLLALMNSLAERIDSACNNIYLSYLSCGDNIENKESVTILVVSYKELRAAVGRLWKGITRNGIVEASDELSRASKYVRDSSLGELNQNILFDQASVWVTKSWSNLSNSVMKMSLFSPEDPITLSATVRHRDNEKSMSTRWSNIFFGLVSNGIVFHFSEPKM
jgi:hypothetical protein